MAVTDEGPAGKEVDASLPRVDGAPARTECRLIHTASCSTSSIAAPSSGGGGARPEIPASEAQRASANASVSGSKVRRTVGVGNQHWRPVTGSTMRLRPPDERRTMHSERSPSASSSIRLTRRPMSRSSDFWARLGPWAWHGITAFFEVRLEMPDSCCDGAACDGAASDALLAVLGMESVTFEGRAPKVPREKDRRLSTLGGPTLGGRHHLGGRHTGLYTLGSIRSDRIGGTSVSTLMTVSWRHRIRKNNLVPKHENMILAVSRITIEASSSSVCPQISSRGSPLCRRRD